MLEGETVATYLAKLGFDPGHYPRRRSDVSMMTPYLYLASVDGFIADGFSMPATMSLMKVLHPQQMPPMQPIPPHMMHPQQQFVPRPANEVSESMIRTINKPQSPLPEANSLKPSSASSPKERDPQNPWGTRSAEQLKKQAAKTDKPVTETAPVPAEKDKKEAKETNTVPKAVMDVDTFKNLVKASLNRSHKDAFHELTTVIASAYMAMSPSVAPGISDLLTTSLPLSILASIHQPTPYPSSCPVQSALVLLAANPELLSHFAFIDMMTSPEVEDTIGSKARKELLQMPFTNLFVRAMGQFSSTLSIIPSLTSTIASHSGAKTVWDVVKFLMKRLAAEATKFGIKYEDGVDSLLSRHIEISESFADFTSSDSKDLKDVVVNTEKMTAQSVLVQFPVEWTASSYGSNPSILRAICQDESGSLAPYKKTTKDSTPVAMLLSDPSKAHFVVEMSFLQFKKSPKDLAKYLSMPEDVVTESFSSKSPKSTTRPKVKKTKSSKARYSSKKQAN